MLRNSVFSVFSLLLILAPLGRANAIPTDSEYKKIKRGTSSTKVLGSCPLVDGVNKIKITQGGKAVTLHTQKNRDSYSLNKKYKFFACGDDGTGNIILFAKAKKTGEPVSFDLTIDDFPRSESNLGSACSSVKSFPGSHIYKTIGSHHFTDIRRNTVGLILKIGASGPFPSCVSALDKEGKEVAKLGLYARGAGWAARYYAGIGCGSRTALNGNAIGSKARKNTGSTNIYMDFGSTCYGPIDATRCIGSSQC